MASVAPQPDAAVELTELQLRFAAEVAADPGSAVRTYRKIFQESSYTSAAKNASRLMALKSVQEEIQAARNQWSKNTRTNFQRVIRKLGSIAFQDPDDFYEPDPENGGLPKLKAWDQITPEARKNIHSIKVKRRKIKADVRTKTKQGEVTREIVESCELEEVEYKILDPMEALKMLCKYLGIDRGSVTPDELRAIVFGAAAGGAAGSTVGQQAITPGAPAPKVLPEAPSSTGPSAAVPAAAELHPDE